MMTEPAPVSPTPARLRLALDGLTHAAVKLRAFAEPGDVEDAALVICAMLRTLRADVEKLRALDDRVERMARAEQLATLAEELAATARLVRDWYRHSNRLSVTAAVDVSVQGMRLALALRSLGSPIFSLAVH